MKILRNIDMWLNSGKKVLPNEVKEYLNSLQPQIIYQRDISSNDTLERLAENYLHSEGIWRITEELRNSGLSPISKEDIYTNKNVFLLRCYYGQYITTYYFSLAAFIKVRDHWKYIGENREIEMYRLPDPRECRIKFIDEYDHRREARCQYVKETHYQY